MKESVEVIARGVCIKSGMILLCQSKNAENSYLPGGHTDFNETARISLEREIVEELGVESIAGRFLGMVEHSFVQKGRQHCEWNVVFGLTIDSLNPENEVVSAEDHIRFKWCRLDELESAKLEPAVLCELLPKWLIDNYEGERWESGGDFVTANLTN